MVILAGLAGAGQGNSGAKSGEWAEKARLAPQSLLLDVSATADRMVAVGERGHILVSRDGGASWTQADVPTRTLLTGVFMRDAQVGWAVGHDEVVLRTRDGGQTWERVNYAPEKEKPLLDVWFADAKRGFAVGAYGELLVTSDGGDSWDPRPVNGGDDFHLNQIVASGDGTVYLAAEAGRIYRSDDGGGTFVPVSSPYQGSFFGLLPLSDQSVLAYGLRGHLYRSRDRGASWEQIETGSEETLTCGVELGAGRFVLGGMAGTLIWGEGASGAVRKQDLPNRKAITALAVANQQLLLFGEGGVQRVDIPR
jgi:photosystem II stability/assembly factor-like uncharacterized protein